MNKVIVVAVVAVVIIVVASIYLFFSPKPGAKASEQETRESSEVSKTTLTTETDTGTVSTISVRECPVSGVRLSVSAELKLVNQPNYPYSLSITIYVINELDVAIKVKGYVITNKSFIDTIINRLLESGVEGFEDNFYGLVVRLEERAITVQSGERARIPVDEIPIPEPVTDLWQAGTLHSVTVSYEIEGLTCSVTESFTVK